jgi:hypothetical protein
MNDITENMEEKINNLKKSAAESLMQQNINLQP